MRNKKENMLYKPRVLSQFYMLNRGNIPVREDDVVPLKTGNRLHYTVLEYPHAVSTIALTGDQRVALVHMPRYPSGQYLWEIPGEKIEKGESAIKCAVRELEEEIGYKARKLKKLITFYPEPSFSIEKIKIFMAEDIVRTSPIAEKEGILEVKLVKFQRALQMVYTGRIKSSWSIIGLLVAAYKLRLCRA